MKRKFITINIFLLYFIGVLIQPLAVQASEQVLNLAVASEPVLDPAYVMDKNSTALLANLFEGLTRPNLKGDIQPGVAERWEISEDQLTYRFYLKESTWNDGSSLTAADFEYAWKRVLDPNSASPSAQELYIIKGAQAYNQNEGQRDDVSIEAIDDLTLEVTLVEAVPQFLELLGRLPEFYPVPQAIVDKDSTWATKGGEDFVTNGPFDLTEWTHQDSLKLTKNDQYWDKDEVRLQRVNIQIVESIATANNLYLNGDIDYLGMPFQTVSADMLDTYSQSGELQTAAMAAFYNYALNTQDPILANKYIRKALALAIDRQTLIDHITKADQTPALRMIGPTATHISQNDVAYFSDSDVELARQYLQKGLAELGIESAAELRLELSTNVSEEHLAIAQYLQENWRTVLGIEVVVTTTEFQVHLDNMRQGDFQLGRRGEGYDYQDAASFLEQYYSTTNGRNTTGWENKTYQTLVAAARSEKDEAVREKMLLEAEAIFMDEMPVIPLFFYTNAYVVRQGIHNMQMDQIGVIQLKDVYID